MLAGVYSAAKLRGARTDDAAAPQPFGKIFRVERSQSSLDASSSALARSYSQHRRRASVVATKETVVTEEEVKGARVRRWGGVVDGGRGGLLDGGISPGARTPARCSFAPPPSPSPL